MTFEFTKMAVRGNMHMDTRVIKAAGFKSEVKLNHRGCLEAAKTYEVTRI